MNRLRLKHVCRLNTRTLTDSSDEDQEIRYCDVSSVERGHLFIPSDTVRFGDAPSRARRLAKAGDSVISTVRPYLKAVAHVPECDDVLVFSTAFAVLEPDPELINSRFLYWVLQSDPFTFEAARGSNGVSYPAITAEDLIRIKIDLPEPSQQERIVRFLDEHTAKIDQLVEEYRRLRDLLALQNEARWHHEFTSFPVVCTEPLKRVLRKLNRVPVSGSGVITAYRDGEVTLRSNRREDGYTFSDAEVGYQGICVGDLVFHGLDGFAGAVGISDSNGQSTPVYHVCQSLNDQDDLRFIAYYLRYLGLSGFLSTLAPSVRQRSVDFRNWQTFARIPLSLPALEGQRNIVARIDDFSQSLSVAQGTIQRAIDLALERRSALVTAAVTGQIEV